MLVLMRLMFENMNYRQIYPGLFFKSLFESIPFSGTIRSWLFISRSWFTSVAPRQSSSNTGQVFMNLNFKWNLIEETFLQLFVLIECYKTFDRLLTILPLLQEGIIRELEARSGDQLGLSASLIKPTQRMVKYKQFLDILISSSEVTRPLTP